MVMIDESILNTIKKMIGFEPNYTAFDEDIIVLINSTIRELYQLGVGTDDFYISDSNSTWADYLGVNAGIIDDVKTYVYCKVRIIFNPPTNSFIVNSYKDTINEMAWRICTRNDLARNNHEENEDE
jgi:hypothetical protein